MKCYIIIFVSIMFAPFFLWADIWTPIGLQGRLIGELIIDNQNPQVMYAMVMTTELMGDRLVEICEDIQKTTNGGFAWKSIKPQEMIFSIRCVTFDPKNTNNIYVGSDMDLFITRDGGETWEKHILYGAGVLVSWIYIHPSDSNVIYIDLSGWKSQILRSTDGGRSWHIICSGSAEYEIYIDQNDPDIFYVWGWSFDIGEEFFFKSLDGGETYTELNLPSADMMGWMFADPNQPDTFYYFLTWQDEDTPKDVIFRSLDGGITWEDYTIEWQEDIAEDAPEVTIIDGRYIVREENSNLLINYDDTSWELVISGMEGISVVGYVFHPQDPRIFAYTDNGIYAYWLSDEPAIVSPAGKKPITWGEMK